MAPARSIQCMKRPPSSAPSGLASLGRTISAISDCESLTGRGINMSSFIILFPFVFFPFVLHPRLFPVLVFCALVKYYLLTRSRPHVLIIFPSLNIRSQKTFSHALHPQVKMCLGPFRLHRIEFQKSVLRGTMFALADVTHPNPPAVVLAIAHSSSRKSDRIPNSLARQTATTLRIAKVAELLQFLLRWNFILVSRRGAPSAPSAAQRKPRCVQPSSVQLLYRHKKRTRHRPRSPSEYQMLGTAHSTHRVNCKPSANR